MTNYQLIALLFPLGTAAACGLFGLGLVKWLNRKYPKPNTVDLTAADLEGGAPSVDDAVMEAHRLIEKARRELARAH
jgi:hypothetical protein